MEIVEEEAKLIARRNPTTNTSAPENARPTELLSKKWFLLQSHGRE